jgi:Sulfotransferase domain
MRRCWVAASFRSTWRMVAMLLLLLRLLPTGECHDEASSSASNLNNSTMILVMGLPRSGSDALHSFFECLGWNSVHYCCDKPEMTTTIVQQQPQRSNRRRRQRQRALQQSRRRRRLNVAQSPTKFPCAEHQVPCGECVHANLLHQRPAFDQCTRARDNDDSDHHSENAQVFASFDVETAEPFAWFLPQHFALPLLLSQSTSSNNNVVWILNQRGTAEQWATNVLHWYSVTRRLLHSFDVPYHDDSDSSSTLDDLDENDMVATAAARGIVVDETNRHWYTALEQSYRRAYNRTAHERRYAALIDIYHRHATKVTEFVESLSTGADQDNVDRQVPRLIHVSVDDDRTAQHLAETLGLPLEVAEACWSFDAAALDNDWLDFSLQL